MAEKLKRKKNDIFKVKSLANTEKKNVDKNKRNKTKGDGIYGSGFVDNSLPKTIDGVIKKTSDKSMVNLVNNTKKELTKKEFKKEKEVEEVEEVEEGEEEKEKTTNDKSVDLKWIEAAKDYGMEHLLKLKIWSFLPQIIQTCENKGNRVVLLVAGTGSGKTVGLVHAYLMKTFFSISNQKQTSGKNKLWVSVPTVLNAKSQYIYLLSILRKISVLPTSLSFSNMNDNNSTRRFALPGIANRSHWTGLHAGGEIEHHASTKQVYFTTQALCNRLCVLLKDIKHHRRFLNDLWIFIDECHHPSPENFMLAALANWMLQLGLKTKIIMASATPTKIFFPLLNKWAKRVTLTLQKQPAFPVTWIFNPVSFGNVLERTTDVLIGVLKKHNGSRGNILIFYPGKTEIHSAMQKLETAKLCNSVGIGKDFVCYICTGETEKEELKDIINNRNNSFDKKYYKVIMATNVASCGITLPDISVVIDSGLIKEKRYGIGSNGERSLFEKTELVTRVISKAEAIQRAGRTGRTRAGIYYICYATRLEYCELDPHPANSYELLCKHQLVLKLLYYGFPAQTILQINNHSYDRITKELKQLNLIDCKHDLTWEGSKISEFQLSIRNSVTLLAISRRCPLTHLDIVVKASNYYELIYFTLALSLIDSYTNQNGIWNIPREFRNQMDRRVWLQENAIKFRGYSDVCVLINLYCDMIAFSTEEANSSSKLSPDFGSIKDKQGCLSVLNFDKMKQKKWCKERHIYYKWMNHAKRLFESTLLILFKIMNVDKHARDLTSDDFIHIKRLCEIHRDKEKLKESLSKSSSALIQIASLSNERFKEKKQFLKDITPLEKLASYLMLGGYSTQLYSRDKRNYYYISLKSALQSALDFIQITAHNIVFQLICNYVGKDYQLKNNYIIDNTTSATMFLYKVSKIISLNVITINEKTRILSCCLPCPSHLNYNDNDSDGDCNVTDKRKEITNNSKLDQLLL